jgi:cytochrome c peroxidase/DNA-binding beta-propeller fold protein YncE
MKRIFGAVLLAGATAHATPPPLDMDMVAPPPPQPFSFLTGKLPQLGPPSDAPSVTLASSAIAADGKDAIVIDADSGALVRVDRSSGRPVAKLEISPGASALAFDARARVAYVADRANDRIIVVQVGDRQLDQVRTFPAHEEPFGLALTPDAKTLLVTHVAGRVLAAYDAASGGERWELPLSAEPRGVAVAPDGKRAMIAYLAADHVDEISLPDHGDPVITPRTLDVIARINSAASTPAVPQPTFVRGAMTTAFIGNGVAVVPHQIDITDQTNGGQVVRSTYGGGFEPPIQSRVDFVGLTASATGQLPFIQQPRGLAWDARADRLFLSGYGTDVVVAIDAASQSGAALAWTAAIPVKGGCGPSSLAVADDGVGMAWCELSRQVAFVTAKQGAAPDVALSDELTTSNLGSDAQRGRALFRLGGDPTLSANGALACVSCHPDGRTDGLTWRIEKHSLQTPLLAGRVAGTAPYKWDGRDATLTESLKHTVQRLGGSGITDAQAEDLQAFLLSLPRPRVPSAPDASAVERGRALFASKDTGCSTCHSGAKLTDGKSHDLAADLDHVDTPSLVAVALSAPYFHDGSAATLRDVVTGKGTITGMGKISGLKPDQVDDLVAYLGTL